MFTFQHHFIPPNTLTYHYSLLHKSTMTAYPMVMYLKWQRLTNVILELTHGLHPSLSLISFYPTSHQCECRSLQSFQCCSAPSAGKWSSSPQPDKPPLMSGYRWLWSPTGKAIKKKKMCELWDGHYISFWNFISNITPKRTISQPVWFSLKYLLWWPLWHIQPGTIALQEKMCSHLYKINVKTMIINNRYQENNKQLLQINMLQQYVMFKVKDTGRICILAGYLGRNRTF